MLRSVRISWDQQLNGEGERGCWLLGVGVICMQCMQCQCSANTGDDRAGVKNKIKTVVFKSFTIERHVRKVGQQFLGFSRSSRRLTTSILRAES